MQSEKIFPLGESQTLKPLLSPNELQQALPLPLVLQPFILESRQVIQNILSGADKRFLLIVGPCSIHDVDSALDYATRLKALSQSISDTFFVVMRIYVEKPRTQVGWKGMVLDPHLDGSHDISTGLHRARQLLLTLAELGLPAATEFLDVASEKYYGDLISWGCIGARTTESQVHRQMASGLAMPIAFKNNTSGNIDVAVNAILASSSSHTFMAVNGDGVLSVATTQGNSHAHLVLRGGSDKPNYDAESIAKACDLLRSFHLPTGVLVDCSHDNSFKKYENQPQVFQSLIYQILAGNKDIRGMLIEGHLEEGHQPYQQGAAELKYGLSITDSCLGWTATSSLLEWGSKMLKSVCLMLFMAVMLSSCMQSDRLSAFTEYVTREQLASYVIGTPDPSLNNPTVGQRLYINWHLPKEYACRDLTLQLRVRFKDRSERTETLRLLKRSGTYLFALYDDEYFERKGVLTYRVDLFADGQLLEEWRHQMWVELITFPDPADEKKKEEKVEVDEEEEEKEENDSEDEDDEDEEEDEDDSEDDESKDDNEAPL